MEDGTTLFVERVDGRTDPIQDVASFHSDRYTGVLHLEDSDGNGLAWYADGQWVRVTTRMPVRDLR